MISRFKSRAALGMCLLALTGGSGCRGEAKKPAAPAKVEGARQEAELATITLTPEAEQRLGIAIATIERKPVPSARVVGGQAEVPPGRNAPLAAPLGGTVLAPAIGPTVVAGSRVRKGQTLFRLGPLPPADRELQRNKAREEVATIRIRLEADQVKTARADQLLRDRAGSLKALQEAQAEEGQAQAALAAAESRLRFLSATDLDAMAAELPSALQIKSPHDGIVTDVKVAPGEPVTAGAALVTVVDPDPMWIRVPVYAGDLAALDTGATARVHLLGQSPKGHEWLAEPIAGPPSANPASASVDLLFQSPNPGGVLRPGQRVSVTLTLRGREEALVAPWSSILFDFEGGAWVYENRAPHLFTRRRVELKHVVDSLAILARGPAAGTKVVTTGAAELFGTEFGSK